MKEIILTCPFTGCEFKAVKDMDNNIYFTHPLTGKPLKMTYNYTIKRYNLPKSCFDHVEVVTFAQAAEILGVSRQRVSAIAAKNVIRPVLLNGQQCFTLDDVLEYKEIRKVGAPRKE